MRKKSITFLLLSFFLIFSVGQQSSYLLIVQSYKAANLNNMLTITASWSKPIVISDDTTGWNDDVSKNPDIAIDGDGNVHVVWQDDTDGEWGADTEIMYANHTGAGWSNITVISDDLTGWNDGASEFPSIAIDTDGNVHVVWRDVTDGEWGTDWEIMYVNQTDAGWSNATVISDDVTGWNNNTSWYPRIAIDHFKNVHVVWEDSTDGEWGTDTEIMYVNYNGAGWSNATVISDDVTGWNNQSSSNPSITFDGIGNIHVVWEDSTDGEWGIDTEIMYTKYTGAGWSNATVISDDATGWNDDVSKNPDIAIDGDGNVHVVWQDDTDGEWGSDYEIMYVNYTVFGWSNATVISDDATGWNDGWSAAPDIVIDSDGNVHVVWCDDTDGEWGIDYEIMYAHYIAADWSNATVISDDTTGWNDDWSIYPDIAIDSDGNLYVVWEDWTDGAWGTDYEIMYSKKSASLTDDNDQPINLIILPVSDFSIDLLSPLGIGIIGIAVATAVIISTVIMKKSK